MIGELIKIKPEQLPPGRQKPRTPPFYKRTWVRVVLILVVALGTAGWFSLKAWLGPFEKQAGTYDLSLLEKLEQSSIIYDRSGREIGRIANENRVLIPLDEMPSHLIDALLATEDKRFWQHNGVDYYGVMRAMKDNFLAGRIKQGASTITQQLARNTYGLWQRTTERKLVEMFLAQRIERELKSKARILELYLNRIPFGKGFYGIEAAAKGYFSKSAKELTLNEAATLVGLVKAPTEYSPLNNLELSKRERNQTLDLMVRQDRLSEEDAERIKAEPIPLKPSEFVSAAGYVQKEVSDEVEKILGELGIEGITGKGYKIYTTVDATLQKAAEESLERRLAEVERRGDYPPERETMAAFTRRLEEFRKSKKPASEAPRPAYLQGAVLAVENKSGAVLAMAGGRNFAQSQYNRVLLSRRPAGTVFTPFVYAAAFEGPYFPGSRVNDQRMDNTKVMLGATTGTLGEWGCETLKGAHEDNISLRKALIQGKNNCVARLGLDLGLDKVKELAARAGFGDLPAEPPTLLGRSEVNLRELCLAYTAFPNAGQRATALHFVTRIEDAEDRVIYKAPARAANLERVTDPMAAWMTHSCMEESLLLDIGTASNARELGLQDMPVAGKTGTHINSTDLWFAGYSDRITCAVWVGLDKKERVYPDAFSRHTALPVWVDIMNSSATDYPPAPLEPPQEIRLVELCSVSGQLATEACLELGADPEKPDRQKRIKCSYMEYIRPGVNVTQRCTLHSEETIVEDAEGPVIAIGPALRSGPAPAGIDPEQAAEDAKPVLITAAVVIGTDPYQSHTGSKNGESMASDGEKLPVSPGPPVLPTAVMPRFDKDGDTPLTPSPGRATVD